MKYNKSVLQHKETLNGKKWQVNKYLHLKVHRNILYWVICWYVKTLFIQFITELWGNLANGVSFFK